MTIKKWIVSIGASVGGMGGMAQAASATASTLGAAGDAASVYSAGSALAGLGAFGGAVSGFGTAALSAAQTMVGMTGTVAQMTTSLAAAGHTAASGLAAGVQAFQMIPGWGWALAGVALLAGAGLGKTRGANHGGGIYSSSGLSDQDAAQSIAGGLGWKDPVTDFITRGNAALSGQVKTAVDSLLEVYAGLGALAKGTVADLEVVAGFAVNGKHKDEDVYGYFKIFNQMTGELLSAYSNREMGKDGDAAWAQYVADLGGAMVSELLKADIPSWMATILTELGEAPTMEALTAGVAKIHLIDAAFGTFSATIDGFAGMTDKAREALMLASGGIEGLSAALGSYYAEYYSDAERLAHSTKAVGDVFADMDIAVPTTRAGLRKLIEEQLALGESGAEAAAKLLKVAPAFAEVTKKAEEVAKAQLEAVGINGAEIAKTLRDSMLGRIDASEAGAQIATMVTDGIYNAVAGGFANQITDLMTTSIITPVIQAAITGASITEAVSQSAIDNMVAQAQAAAAALGQVLNNPAFKDAIAQIGAAVSGAFGGGGRGAAGGGGGSSNSLFVIGGSAIPDRGYQPPELQAFDRLATETIASNDQVAKLLKDLLNPKKDYESRYLELAEKLVEKQTEYNVSGRKDEINSIRNAIDTSSAVMEKLGPYINGFISSINSVYVAPSATGYKDGYNDITFSYEALSEMFKAIEEHNGGAFTPGVGTNFVDGIYGLGQTGNLDQIGKYINQMIAGFSGFTESELQGKIANLENLERELREWYIAQARVIAVEDLTTLAVETKQATAKTEELKRTGGLEDPVTKLKESLASKMRGIDEGIGAALLAEVEILKGQKVDTSKMEAVLSTQMASLNMLTADGYLEVRTSFLSKTLDDMDAARKLNESAAEELRSAFGESAGTVDEASARSAYSNHISVMMYLDNQYRWFESELARLNDGGLADDINAINAAIAKAEEELTAAILAATDPAKQQALLDEIALYKGGITEWYKAQADLLSTEMLVDINKQIKELEANEKGPLTTIKDAIAKYLADFKALGTLTAEIHAQVDKLEGLQLTKARKALYDQLLSPEELKTSNEYDLTMQFMGLGAAMPASTTALRDMIDAARAVGNIMLADSLLELVPAFVALQGAASGLSSALDDALKIAQKSTDDAFAALQRAVDAQRKSIGGQLTAAQELQREVGSVFDTLKSAVSDLYRSVDSTAQQSAATARAFIANALSGALATGALPDSKELQDAIAAARGSMDGKQYATQFDADRDRLVLAGQLDQLKAVGGKQLTEAERQIKVLQEQLDALDLTLQTARDQIDVMRGIDISVLSVESAVQGLGVAMAAETAAILALAAAAGKSQAPAGGSGGGYSAPSYIDSAYQQLFGREADSAGAAYWQGTGLTGSALIDAMAGGAKGTDLDSLPKFADGGAHAGGLRVVGERGWEVEATGPSRIWNQQQLGQALQGGGNADLVAAVERLTAQNAQLVARLESIERNTSGLPQLVDQIDNVTEGGNAMRSEVMPSEVPA